MYPLDKTDNEEQSDNDRGDAGSEESGLQLVVDIRGESESATDEDRYAASGIRHIPEDVRVRRGECRSVNRTLREICKILYPI